MRKHLETLLAFLLLFNGHVMGQQSWYTPFPYPTEKEVTGDSAVVVSAHPLATQVGVDILRRGGNAADAAVAVQFALAVVYPQAGNIGGGGFLVYRGKDITATLDYREKAPAGAYETMYLDSSGQVVSAKSRYGALASGVPGTVDGMWTFHQKFGKLPWGELINPAIELAQKGFQVTEQEAENLNEEKLFFVRNSSIIPAFVKFEPWKKGDWLIQRELSLTLARIAGEGRKGFYEGATATLLVQEMEKKGGMLRREDLRDYRSVWRFPLEFDYKDYRIISMGPPSSGGIILQQLFGMLSASPLSEDGFHTPAAVHRMVEAERRAFADRATYLGDPDFWKVPVRGLTHPAYLSARMADFDPTKAGSSAQTEAGKVVESEETTHYCVVDFEGNAVSVTTTLNDRYGSRTVVAGGGFILNNEMDDFSAKPGTPNLYGAIGGKANAIVAGKRPLSSMTPTIVTRKGKVFLIVGTPGGTTIPTSVFQVLINVLDYGKSLPEAVQSGRFHHQWRPDHISVEADGLPAETLKALESMGHSIRQRGGLGRVEAIIRLDNNRWQGVADKRGDDTARGY
jgi:gamma-glutamyltranspeptidase/glutathione hydrolase